MNNLSKQTILAMVVSALALATLPGCFTGIENTPKIKADSVTKKKTSQTPEQKLIGNLTLQSVDEWQPGKPFIVTNGRLNYAYTPAAAAERLREGDTLKYVGMHANVRLAGDSITEVVLTTPSGTPLTTTIESPVSSLRGKSLALPFLVDAQLVDDARSLLRGKTVWTLRTDKQGKRYQKAEIADVLVGNSDFPIKVALPTDTLLMLLNSRSTSSRTFDNLFSLSDPRKHHPEISDKNWDLICRGKVAIDMTREECRLALGAPAEIDRTTTYNGIIERWTYQDGKFLIFTDGLLTRFRF